VQKLVPTSLLLIAIAVSLMAIWIGYSQIVMIKRSISCLRKIDNLAVVKPKNDFEESAATTMKSTMSDEVELSNSTQTEEE
jgi:hypothetical protein